VVFQFYPTVALSRFWCEISSRVPLWDQEAIQARQVPLWDQEAIQARQRRKPVRCWFSGKKVPLWDQEAIQARAYVYGF
jgi:hypothetical protein